MTASTTESASSTTISSPATESAIATEAPATSIVAAVAIADLNEMTPGRLEPIDDGPFDDGQLIRVRGTGFDAGVDVAVGQCLLSVVNAENTQSHCDLSNAVFPVVANADGGFETDFTIRRFIFAETGAADCAFDTCIIGAAAFSNLQIANDGTEPSGGFEVELIDTGPPPPPRMSLDRSEDLEHHEIIIVSFDDWLVDPTATLCVDEPGFELCDLHTAWSWPNEPVAGDQIALTASRVLYTAAGPIDCSERGCAVVLRNGIGQEVGQSITFEGGAPPPELSWRIEPGGPYTDGQDVTLIVSGSPPWSFVEAAMCPEDQQPGALDGVGCFYLETRVIGPGDGDRQLRLTAQPAFFDGPGPAPPDCREIECSLQVWDAPGFEPIPIEFVE